MLFHQFEIFIIFLSFTICLFLRIKCLLNFQYVAQITNRTLSLLFDTKITKILLLDNLRLFVYIICITELSSRD